MDVRPLLADGTIAAAHLRDNTVSIDRDIFDVLFPRLNLKPTEQAVYLQLYRHSFGRGLNSAQLSNAELQRLCNISHSCVRTALRKLRDKGCLERVRPGIQHDASIYRVLLPSELLEYDSTTKVEYRDLDPKRLAEAAQREEPEPEPEYEGPALQFNMLRPSNA
jgi:predicted transcriptional regulator